MTPRAFSLVLMKRKKRQTRQNNHLAILGIVVRLVHVLIMVGQWLFS